MTFYPLVMPVIAAVAGGALGHAALSRYRRGGHGGQLLLPVLVVAAIAAALMPNAGQQLYEMGLSTSSTRILARVSYAFFSFCVAGAWVLLQPSRMRWLLMALIPVSFAQPVLWTFALFTWSTRGFAP